MVASAGSIVVEVQVKGLADAFRRLAHAQRALAELAAIQAKLLEETAIKLEEHEPVGE